MPIINPTDDVPTNDVSDDASASAPQGALLIEGSSCARAWVENIDGDGPRTVTLLLNGEHYWTGLAERLEHPEFNLEKPRLPCGISVALPAPTSRPHFVTVGLVVDGAQIATAEADLSRRYSGFLDKVESRSDGLLVEGWAHDV